MADWADLTTELDRWAGLGKQAGLWWRDDDATAPGPRLQTLLDLSRSSGVAAAIAVIPGAAEDALAEAVAELPGARMLVHGLRHENHAPETEKKAEFGPHRPVHEMLGDAAIAWQNLAGRFPGLALPVFVPPWNRIDDDLVPRLPLARLQGLSRFGPRTAAPTADFVECNCHLDLIDWRGGCGFIGQDQALDILIAHLRARRDGTVDGMESSGVLSHHDVMDQIGWDFLQELFARTQESDGAHWLTIDEVFRLPQ
jgi:hypothetical protein